MGLLYKLQRKLFGQNTSKAPQPYAPTNTEIVDHIFEVFKRVLAHRSVDDDIFFDTVFVTLLPATVAKDVITMAAALAPTIVKRFYKELREHRAQGKSIVPVGNYWQFSFIVADPMDEMAQQQLQVLSFITDPSNEQLDLIKQAEMGQVSINGEHSLHTDINVQLLRNVDVIERGKVRLRISLQLELDTSQTTASTSIASTYAPQASVQGASIYAPKPTPAASDVLAEIMFLLDGKQMVYKMRKPYLIVGRAMEGEKATLDRLPIFTREQALLTDHFHIRYDALSRTFAVATLGAATLSEMTLPVSPSDDQLIWTPLRQSCALVYGLGHISFKALY